MPPMPWTKHTPLPLLPRVARGTVIRVNGSNQSFAAWGQNGLSLALMPIRLYHAPGFVPLADNGVIRAWVDTVERRHMRMSGAMRSIGDLWPEHMAIIHAELRAQAMRLAVAPRRAHSLAAAFA